MQHSTLTTTGYLGDLRLVLTSAVCDGEILDTTVDISGQTICSVAGSQRNEFLEALAAVVDQFRI